MNRRDALQRLQERSRPWDIVVVGGGASGVGIAVDAASRGYDTLLLEQHDFGKGTSSRSTKLVHGGVRYLEQGNLSLVMEALKERGLMRRNAPHLVHELPFVVPSYSWWEGPFYGIGLKIYQGLSGRLGFGPSQWLSKEETLERLPNIRIEGLRGGVVYYDGQFDDARLLIHLVATADGLGATLVNYAPVSGLLRDAEGSVAGVIARDAETGQAWEIAARVVINATGPFADAVRRLADPQVQAMISPSQGAHVVLDRSFLPGDAAIMVPHTSDGRVMFAIPWHGHTLVGTTDAAVDAPSLEPVPLDQEIEFILGTAGLYLDRKPTRADVLSVFAGIRPLVKAGSGASTAALSRDHLIHIDPTGLITLTGGKWTTYRKMAEDCIDQAATLASLPERPCVTRDLKVHGYDENADRHGDFAVYGADAPRLRALIEADPRLGERLDPVLPICGAQVVWAAREEMARTVEDVLARRTRALFLNAAAAVRMAPRVANLLGAELGRDEAWGTGQVESFATVARGYLPVPGGPGRVGGA